MNVEDFVAKVVFSGLVEIDGYIIDCDSFNYFDYDDMMQFLIENGIDEDV